VTISGFTLNGDNPNLTGGINIGGANVDARDGIITDHRLGVAFNNLTVSNVIAKNIYMRGIYASSGGTFNFTGNTVSNINGNQFSVAIFNFGGAGTIANNTVFNTNDAISSNHSRGVSYLSNTITDSDAGVHTDNSGDFGGTADVINGNVISNCKVNGYGLYSFAPRIGAQFTSNTVSNCLVGMAVFGNNGASTSPTVFSDNVVDGVAPVTNSIGALASTSLGSFGVANVTALFAGNVIKHFETGLYADGSRGGLVNGTAHHNVIAGNTTGADAVTSLTFNAQNNFWGCSTGPGAIGCDTVATTSFSTNPWLISRLTLTPDPPAVGQITTLTVDLTFNSDGVQPAGGPIPDGTPVDFDSVPAGTVFTPDPDATLDGIATTTFAAASGVQVCARVPGDVPTAALECITPNLSSPVASEACPATPYPLVAGATLSFTGSTLGRIDDFFSFCGDETAASDAPDVVYAFTLPEAGTLKIDVTSLTGGYNPAIYLRTDCITDFYCADYGNQTELIFGDFPAGTYFVVIDGSGNTSGDYQMTVNFNVAACGDGVVNLGAGEECDVGAGVANDGCGDPGTAGECQTQPPLASADVCNGTPVSVPLGTITLLASSGNSTIGYTDNYAGTCTPAVGGRDRVYQLTPQASGTMTVKLGAGTDGVTPICSVDLLDPGCWDGALYARSTCTDALTQLACSDRGAVQIETITFPVIAATPYWVFVDGYDNQYYSSGPFNLVITLQ
jgi:hypothetical protein